MVSAFLLDRAGQAAVAIFMVGLLQFLLTQAAAVRDRRFTIEGATGWLRVTFMGVIVPIWLLLFVGWAAEGVPLIGDVLMLSAIAWAGIFVAETIKGIFDEWIPRQRPPEEPLTKDPV